VHWRAGTGRRREAALIAGGRISTARDITVLALPMLAVSLTDIAMSFIDTVVIGRVGTVALAGVALGSAVHIIFSQIIGSSAIGFRILAARRLGAGDRGGTAALLRPLLAVGILGGLLGSAVIAGSAPWLMRRLAGDPVVAAEATAYVQVRTWSLAPLIMVILLRMVCECDRKPASAMRVLIPAQVVNALLTPTLAFGWIGPAYGVRGTAAASVIAMTLAAVLLLRTVSQLLPELRRAGWAISEAKRAGRLGAPEVASSGLDYLGNLAFVALIALIGTVELAAGHIGIIVVTLLFIVSMTFAVATQILIGRRLGASPDPREALRIYHRSRPFLFLIGLSIAAASPLWARGAAWLFSDAAAVREAVYQPLVIVGLTAVVMVLATHATAGLRALGRTRDVMLINVGAVWLIQLPVAYLAVRLAGSAALSWVMSAYFGYFLVRAVLADVLVRRHFASLQPQPTA
jgi:MATE family multidrug resistance protein